MRACSGVIAVCTATFRLTINYLVAFRRYSQSSSVEVVCGVTHELICRYLTSFCLLRQAASGPVWAIWSCDGWPVVSSPLGSSQVDSTRSVHHVDGSSHGQFNTGQFITKTVIVINISFSKVSDTWWLLSGKCPCDSYQENVQDKV